MSLPERNRLITGDNLSIMLEWPDEFVDLIVTSPPYDDLRTYGGHEWDFEQLAYQIAQVLKPGGVLVWIVADATVDGCETLTSMRQALYFNHPCGLRMHDTMIWQKSSYSAVGAGTVRYYPVWEYMFVMSKGAPKTFNPLKDRKNKWAGTLIHGTVREADGSMKPVHDNK